MTLKNIQVYYRRSGGIAGIDMTAHVDAGQLPGDEGAAVVALLSVGVEPPTGPELADGFSYYLTVSDGSISQTYHWEGGRVPPVVKPLLSTLTQLAVPARPAR